MRSFRHCECLKMGDAVRAHTLLNIYLNRRDTIHSVKVEWVSNGVFLWVTVGGSMSGCSPAPLADFFRSVHQ